MTRLLLDRSTNQLLPYPRQDDEPVAGLDCTAAYVVELIRESEPEYDPSTHYLQPLEPVVNITDPDSDDVNGTATYGWELLVIPAPTPDPPQPRWAEFGLMVMEMPQVKLIFAQAIAAGEAPLAVGLGVALGKAADGQSALFLGIWAKAVAHGLVLPELNGQVQALATAFDLPTEFIAGLAGPSQTG
jgi:hypothetical protein